MGQGVAVGQRDAPDPGCLLKAEKAGFAGGLDEGVRERDEPSFGLSAWRGEAALY